MTRRNTIRTVALGLALLTFLPFSNALAGARGHCIGASIPEAFVMPDGRVFPAGPLKMCYSRDYSPVSGMHKTWADGAAIGMYVSQRSRTEGLPERAQPYFLFERGPEGELRLLSYAVPDGDAYQVYFIPATGKNKHDRTLSPILPRWAALPSEGTDDAGNVVLVAAVVD
jgi:hypothetical protein